MSDPRKPESFWTRLAQQVEQERVAERGQTTQASETPSGARPDEQPAPQRENSRRRLRMRGGTAFMNALV